MKKLFILLTAILTMAVSSCGFDDEETSGKAPNKTQTEDDDSSLASISLFFIIVAGVGGYVFYMYNKNKTNKPVTADDTKQIKPEVDEKETVLNQIEGLKNNINDINGKQASQAQELVQLGELVVSLQAELQQLKMKLNQHPVQSQPAPSVISPPTPPVNVAGTFPAQAIKQNGQTILKKVDSQYASQVAFLITVNGDSGTYKVNENAASGLLTYADSKILPFCSCKSITSGVPSRVVTVREGKIEKYGEQEWLVTVEAEIQIN